MYNKAMIIGHLGADPEVREAGSSRVANFSVATKERWRDKGTDEQRERTEWHRVVAWGRLAENIERYLRKGSKVMVEGKLQTRKWTDREGNPRTTTEIHAREVVFLSAKGGEQRDDEEIPF